MRNRLLACCGFDWSRISPAVFGSLFQSVMEPRERRQIGGHYTSERDILKLVRSLFLDDLRSEFAKIKGSKSRLEEFHKKLGELTFFDPACGCGNFLVVTYRELRLLEIEILKILYGKQKELDIHRLSLVDVDAMYGIEISEFPVRIAEVALWLVDHQMNQRLSEAFGQYFVRLPLKKSAKIVNANALRIDWRAVLPPEKCFYILGNPPFVGKKARNIEQQADMEKVFGKTKGTGELDYVCCWYARAIDYVANTNISTALVSTNSITQGEQPGLLWPPLLQRAIQIHFAHRTFSWESEARGKAHVHVVIIGFGQGDAAEKKIWDYERNENAPDVIKVKHISPYLVEGSDSVLLGRRRAICAVPEIKFGNMPNDDGNYLFSDEQKRQFISDNPESVSLFRPFLSSKEYLHGIRRWCLWLKDSPPNLIRSIPGVYERVQAVQKYRAVSKRLATKKLAEYPALFGEIRQKDSKYILVPRHSSENRRYIPIAYFGASFIVGDSCLFINDATLFHFGILTSMMHMAWVRQVCGRIKSDFRYSNELVYNNYPWPESPTEKQKAAVEEKAQAVLDARAEFPDSSLADLYDPLTMPAKLAKAHAELDRAVDACYRPQPFHSDRERVEFLFALYEKLTSPLTAGLTQPKRSRSKKQSGSN